MFVLFLLLTYLMEDSIEDVGQINQLIFNEIDIHKKTWFIDKFLIRKTVFNK